ncbi:aspartate kinase [Rickettsiales bacterium]|nr:aspartate kinase [Rickettsiales bacterium]
MFKSIKFGGTSVCDVKSMFACADIVKNSAVDSSVVVTVSATGGTTVSLCNIVSLVKDAKLHQALRVLSDIKKKHICYLYEITDNNDIRSKVSNRINHIIERIEQVIHGSCLIGAMGDQVEASILSIGEKLSALLFTYVLREYEMNSKYVNAEDVIVTDNKYLEADILWEETASECSQKIKPLLSYNTIPVVTGFIGRDKELKTTLLGMGGSDYTASILGIVLGADSIEIWTDVDGIFSADPRIVKNAKLWNKLDIDVVSEMSLSGAKIIHPKSIMSSVLHNVPVWVFNSKNVKSSGTEIVRDSSNGIKAITNYSCDFILCIKNQRTNYQLDLVNKVLSIFKRKLIPIDVLVTSESSISFSFNGKYYDDKDLMSELGKLGEIDIIKSLSKVCVIGQSVMRDPGCIAKVFSVAKDLNVTIKMVSIGSSDNNITIIVNELDAEGFVVKLHNALIEDVIDDVIEEKNSVA